MMHRFFLTLGLLGFLSACTGTTPTAQVPQVINREPTTVATVEVTRVVAQVVIATPTSRPAEPTAVATEPPARSTASVVNGGNLRLEARVAATTVIGQVCPGD